MIKGNDFDYFGDKTFLENTVGKEDHNDDVDMLFINSNWLGR